MSVLGKHEVEDIANEAKEMEEKAKQILTKLEKLMPAKKADKQAS